MSQHLLWLDEENWVATMHNDGYNMHSFAMCNVQFPWLPLFFFCILLPSPTCKTNERADNIFRLWTGKKRIDRLDGDGSAAKLVK